MMRLVVMGEGGHESRLEKTLLYNRCAAVGRNGALHRNRRNYKRCEDQRETHLQESPEGHISVIPYRSLETLLIL